MIKIKDFDQKIKHMKDKEKSNMKEIRNYESNIASMENQLKNLKENFEFELKEKTKLEEKNNNLILQIKPMMLRIKEFYKDEMVRNELSKKFSSKMKIFFDSSLATIRHDKLEVRTEISL
jgi:hypothetical protein